MDRLIKYILAIVSFTLCSLNTYCQNWLGIEKRTDKAKVVWTKRITKYNPNNHEAELISTEKYNEKGFKTFMHDPFDEEYIYKYDNNDNIVEILNYEPGDDTLTAKQKFTYDKNNKLVEECVYRHDILESRNTYSYDEKGNRTEFIVYSEDNKVLSISATNTTQRTT